MSNTLCTKFGRNVTTLRQDSPLDDSQLMRVAPSIFAPEKHSSRSDRYTYIPTIEVLNGLRKEGFQPFAVAQSRTRIEGKQDFTKHMLRLRRASQITAPEANETILINSHDGTSSYQMLSGVYRFVCHNGLITGETLDDVRVQHKGNIVNNVIEAAYTILDTFDAVDASKDEMKSTRLALPEAEIFATAALALKYDEQDVPPVTARQVLQTRRAADMSNDVWTTFNRVQENLMAGGLDSISQSGRRQKTRAVQSIDTNVKLNRALWILAEKMAELKR